MVKFLHSVDPSFLSGMSEFCWSPSEEGYPINYKKVVEVWYRGGIFARWGQYFFLLKLFKVVSFTFTVEIISLLSL